MIVLLTFTTKSSNSQTYCVPSHGNASYFLSSFSTSGAHVNINNPSGLPPGGVYYTDFSSSQYVKADPGDAVSWSMTTSQYYTYKRIWVDWNRDGDFVDVGETMYGSNVVGATIAGSFNIPSTARGQYRMRVQIRYYGSVPSPCGYYLYGETEDYSLLATTGNDLKVVDLEKGIYCSGSQSVKALVKNEGNNNITSFKVNASLGSTNFSTYNYSGTLQPDSFLLVTLGNHSFSTSSIDTLSLFSYDLNSGIDSNTLNDTLTGVYRAGLTGTYTIGGTSPDYTGFSKAGIEMAQKFHIEEKDTITGIAFYLNFPQLGDSIKVKLYEDNSGPGSVLAESNSYRIVSNAGRWYYLEFSCLEVLDSGSYFIALEQMSARPITLGMSKGNFRSNVAFAKDTSGLWSSMESQGLPYLFSLRMILDQYDLAQINLPSSLCSNGDSLVVSAIPAGGIFSGIGLRNDSIFDPGLSGVGSFEIRYTLLNSRGCVDTSGHTIRVDTVPTVSFTNPADLCETAAPISLSSGLPAGGVYSGPGISGSNLFDPSSVGAGSYALQYRYGDINGCKDSTAAQIVVVGAPSVSFGSVPDVCADASSFPLFQGSPSGGVYSGIGISSDSIFDPSSSGVGVFTIDYTFTDSLLCSGSASQDVVVNALPLVDLGDDLELCGTQLDTVDAGNPGSTYLWSNGKTDQSFSVNQSDTLWVQVTDVNLCVGTDTIVVNNTGVCVGVNELNQLGARIKLFPNPTEGAFHILILGLEGLVQVEVRDARGKLIRSKEIHTTGNLSVHPINLMNESGGIYTVSLLHYSGTVSYRISVK